MYYKWTATLVLWPDRLDIIGGLARGLARATLWRKEHIKLQVGLLKHS